MRLMVIGTGSIGLRHLAVLKGLGEHDLACVEPDAERRKEAWRFTGKQNAYASLEDADAFQVGLVCTPTHRHVDDALAVLKCGANLIIEKPVAHEMHRGDQLQQAAKDALVMVACPMRFHLGISELQKQVQQMPTPPWTARAWYRQAMAEWRPNRDASQVYSAHRQQGGGLFLDRIHELDLMRWLFGDPSQVRASVTHDDRVSFGDVEANAYGHMVHDTPHGQVFTSVDLDCVSPGYHNGVQVIGAGWTLIVNTAPEVDGKAQMQGWDQAMIDQSRHWIRCLHGDEEPVQDLMSAYRVLQTAIALYVSAETNTWCALNQPEAKAA